MNCESTDFRRLVVILWPQSVFKAHLLVIVASFIIFRFIISNAIQRPHLCFWHS